MASRCVRVNPIAVRPLDSEFSTNTGDAFINTTASNFVLRWQSWFSSYETQELKDPINSLFRVISLLVGLMLSLAGFLLRLPIRIKCLLPLL